jgi:hypothetical protein
MNVCILKMETCIAIVIEGPRIKNIYPMNH